MATSLERVLYVRSAAEMYDEVGLEAGYLLRYVIGGCTQGRLDLPVVAGSLSEMAGNVKAGALVSSQ